MRCPGRTTLEEVLAGGPGPAETVRVVAHIRACPACGAEFERVRDLDEKLRASFGGSAAGGAGLEAAGPCPGDEALAALLDGGLDPAEREEVLAHAASCPGCRLALGEAARTLADAPGEEGVPAAPEARPAGEPARPSASAKPGSQRARAPSPHPLPPAGLHRRPPPARSRLPLLAAVFALIAFGAAAVIVLRARAPESPRLAQVTKPEAPPEAEPEPAIAPAPPAPEEPSLEPAAPAAEEPREAPQGAESTPPDAEFVEPFVLGEPAGGPPSAPFPVESGPAEPSGPEPSPPEPPEEPEAPPGAGAAPLPPSPPRPEVAPPLEEPPILIAEVNGRIEARVPGGRAWAKVGPGASLPAGTEFRPRDRSLATMLLGAGLHLTLRGETIATVTMGKNVVEIGLPLGALAAEPRAEGLRVAVEVPQGTVSSAGFIEVLARKQRSLVAARGRADVVCTTPMGSVRMPGGYQTVLFNDRAPLAPFPLPGTRATGTTAATPAGPRPPGGGQGPDGGGLEGGRSGDGRTGPEPAGDHPPPGGQGGGGTPPGSGPGPGPGPGGPGPGPGGTGGPPYRGR